MWIHDLLIIPSPVDKYLDYFQIFILHTVTPRSFKLKSRHNVSMWIGQHLLSMYSQLMWDTSKLLNHNSLSYLNPSVLAIYLVTFLHIKLYLRKTWPPLRKALWIFNLLFIKTSFIFMKMTKWVTIKLLLLS